MSPEIPPTIDLPNVAFIGKAGAGKTTGADFLAAEFGYMRASFAKPLKDVAAQIWGESARTDRAKLQGLGVAVRDIDPDAWCTLLVRQIRQAPPQLRWVVDDCRFPNEYQALGELGFVFIRVIAYGEQRIDRLVANGKLTDVEQLNHISETALDGVVPDYVIGNSDTTGTYAEVLTGIINKEARRS